MTTTPLLSVCIPTYNRCKHLDSLLESFCRQIEKETVPGQVEVVICDNASTDSTQKIGEKWAARHSFIRYFRNEWNIGGDPNQIRAAEKAQGQFCWIFGDDDKIREKAVAGVLSRLKPGVDILFVDYRCMTQDGVCLAQGRLRPDIPDDITTLELVKKLGYITAFSLITSHVFDRKQFFAADPAAIVKISPWYVINTILIVAFHDKKCVLVRPPLIDFTMDNDRLPDENVLYVRVMGLLNTLRACEATGKIDEDFLFGCYESGAGNRWNLGHHHYFREEIYWSIGELLHYWALPGRADAQVLRAFIDRGPGFWDIRNRLKNFFIDDFHHYRKHQKPIIHFWHGQARFPVFSVLLSSDDPKECEAFDHLMVKWPEHFEHESILISRIPEDQFFFEHIHVFMAPFQPHRSPGASLNSGFRKILSSRAFIVDQVRSPLMPQLIDQLDAWRESAEAPASCLMFESISENGTPTGLLGLYLRREEMVFLGGFENHFHDWSRQRLLADGAYRLRSRAWAIQGGEVSRAGLEQWFSAQLPAWLRLVRTIWKRPFSEHGLNITLRGHLERLRREAQH